MKRDLRIIFMGTPDFAVTSLEILVTNGFQVVAVVTAPDKPSGRGLKMTYSAVKEAALKHQIPVLQPNNLKSPAFLEELKSYQANLQIVVAFRMLPEVVWSMPEYGTFNLHASLLPKYRGAAPINWAIINGEKETGLTTFFLQHQIDTGDVILQEAVPIGNDDDFGTMYDKLKNIGAETLLKTVQLIRDEKVVLRPQNEMGEIKHAPKIFKETCEINFNQSAEAVRNFIRGLAPYPAAWTNLKGKFCKITKAQLTDKQSNIPAGEISTDGKKYLYFATTDNFIAIERLQMEGKKEMGIEEFLRGFKV